MLDAATRPRLVRGLTIGLGAATVAIGLWLVLRDRTPPPAAVVTTDHDDSAGLAVDRSPDPTTDPTTDSATEPASEPASEPAAEPASDPSSAEASLPPDCAALTQRGREGGPDAVLLAWLCPQVPLDPVAARAAVLAVRSPDEAAALVPRVAGHPALTGLLRLVAQDAIRPAVAAVPDPTQAVVSPIDERVLAQVQRAHTLIATPGLAPGQRTRARAFVAKVYLQATQQIGVGVGRPTSPFARLLIGRALHYGRLFCQSYWRMRVRGLAGLFGEVETRLLALVLALEGDAHHGDAARLAVELDETRRYLLREGPQTRIERRLADRRGTPWGPERLLPLPNALDRLLDHGFVDLALSRGLAEARRPGGPGLRPVEQLLRDGLTRAERDEYTALLDKRLRQARVRPPSPPEQGPGNIEHAAEPPWPSADAVADEAVRWIERTSASEGLPARYALGRALLVLRPRPDAVAVLLDRAIDEAATPALRRAGPWLAQELAARDDGRLPWLQRRAAVERLGDPPPARSPAIRHAQEAARRRTFAVTVREDGRLPRGAGL